MVTDSHFEVFGGHARQEKFFTGDTEEAARTIIWAGLHAGDLSTPRSKFAWKELNSILGLAAWTNDDREQRMLECERQELHYANKVGTNKADTIETKSYTVTQTSTVGRRHNQEEDRTTTTRENKQAKVVKGNLRARASTIWKDYKRLSAFLSTAMKNPVWGRSVCISLAKLMRQSGGHLDGAVVMGMRNTNLSMLETRQAEKAMRHVIYGWCQWKDIAVIEEADEAQAAVGLEQLRGKSSQQIEVENIDNQSESGDESRSHHFTNAMGRHLGTYVPCAFGLASVFSA